MARIFWVVRITRKIMQMDAINSVLLIPVVILTISSLLFSSLIGKLWALNLSGQCPFVQKARRAQFAGAKLLIIIDNIIQPVNSILLSDDGTGRDITIPSMLVHKNTGASLLKYLEKDQNKSENWVTLKAVFDTW